MKRIIISIIIAAIAGLGFAAIPAASTARVLPPSQARTCQVQLHAVWELSTINGIGPWFKTKFRTGTTTCGDGLRAALNYCTSPRVCTSWAHGGWKAVAGVYSKAQAPPNVVVHLIYAEFRDSTGCWHWKLWPPPEKIGFLSHCP